MNSSDRLGVMGILIEPLKIVFRNGKLMASITLLTLLPYFLLLLGNYFSTASFFFDLVMNLDDIIWDPEGPDYQKLVSDSKKYIEIIVGIELIFTLALCAVFLLSTISIVYASAVTYSFEKLTLKELLIRIKRTWMSLAITSFYVSLMSVGCTLLILAMVGLVLMVAEGLIAFVLLCVLLVPLVLGIKLYLSLFWVVGLVVSVLEDGCYGLEALGKAQELIKGRKLQGFIITLVLALVLITISGFLGYGMDNIFIRLPLMLPTIIILWKIYSFMTYTVFYCECKKTHGKEVEEKSGLGYNFIPAIPNVSEDLP